MLDRADVRSLDRIDAVALAFTGPATALALLSYAAPPAQDEVDRRAALGDAWPGSDDSAAYADGFRLRDRPPGDRGQGRGDPARRAQPARRPR